MPVYLILGFLFCLVAIVATICVIASDDYRRVPTRREEERDDWR